MNKSFRMTRLAGALALVLATAPAFAQNTSAGATGVVTTNSGAPIANAEVEILHVPSGTVRRVSTDASGRYSARGLRVGGPYSITVIGEGYASESNDNVMLVLDQSKAVNFDLDEAATLGETTVVGTRISETFSPDKMGSGTSISNEQVEGLPSINRSLQDYARLDPRIAQTDKGAGQIQALGQNNRFNLITIDGVTTNDTFGLEGNNLPTSNQPMSIDAIEAVDVSIANYDVTQTGYTGARINAVTKSGTNEFHGSLYGVYRDSDWVGDDKNGNPFRGFKDESTYGFTLGGPIVKDTLFFFLNYEQFKRRGSAPSYGPEGFGASNTVPITQEQINEVIQIAQSRYGVDAGSFNPGGSDNEDTKILAKIDWNINDYHRASLRYNKVEQTEAVFRNLDRDDISLSSHWFNQEKTFENYALNVYSDWTDSFSTEAKLAFSQYRSEPKNNSRLPQVRVNFGRNQVNFGTEQFRHANRLETDKFNAFLAGTYYLDNHEIKAGLDYEKNDIFNLFLESSLGRYDFGSLEDFRNGNYRSYVLRAPAEGRGLNDVAADWTYENLGLFVQDMWFVNDNLTLTFGVRADIPMVDDKPTYNSGIEQAFGYRNDVTIDGNELVEPRFGFNYTFGEELQSQFRGGFGLFQGAAANVWLSNPFTNNGLDATVYGCGSSGLARCGADRPEANLNPDQQPRYSAGNVPAADVDLVSSDLGQPAVWKANLAFDQELGLWDMVFSTELLWAVNKQAIYYEHLNLGAPTRIGPDGRVMYWNAEGYDPSNFSTGFYPSRSVRGRANANPAFREVLLAKPTDKGNAQSLTVSLSKPLTEHWGWQAAYTFTAGEEVNQLTSSRAISNWGYNVVFNHEEDAMGTSSVIRNRFTAGVMGRYNFFGDNTTEFGLFYEGRSGRPFSYRFANDANGDGRTNDLLYIPRPGEVSFANPEEEAAFWSYINSNEYLSSHMGQVAGRYDARSAIVHNFDLRVSQELPGFMGDDKFKVILDLLNVGNMLNNEWGVIEDARFGDVGTINYGGIDADGRYVYRFTRPRGTSVRDEKGQSRWGAQVTVKYEF